MDEALAEAYALRRAMLGNAYVDAQIAGGDDVLSTEFQDYVTQTTWGVWTRGGPLSTRDRSLLVMAMTAALGRVEEFRLHASSQANTGVSDEEIDELIFQVTAYCGAPAGITARRVIKGLRAEREASP